jgi:hypothetical protein
MNQYLLKPRPPRILAPAALLIVAGGACAGVALAWIPKMGWWIATGVTAGIGLVLLIVGLSALRRLRVWVELDNEGYSIFGPAGEYTGSWRDVSRVAVSKRQDKLALYHGETSRTIIAHPAGAPDDEFRRLRLDIDRFLAKR